MIVKTGEFGLVGEKLLLATIFTMQLWATMVEFVG
jgi:hypothetical protein